MSERMPKRHRHERRVGRRMMLGLAIVVVASAAVAAGLILTRGGNSASVAAQPSASSTSGAVPRALQLAGIDPVTGKEVRLASFTGRPVAINVWASWCTGCYAEAAALGKFARQHPEIQVVGLDIQDSMGGAKSFYRRFGWKHPSIFDPSGALAARLRVQGLPTTIFLDRRHREATRIVGEADLAAFEQGLRKAKGI